MLAAGLLAAAALPFLHASYGNGDPRTLPAAAGSRPVAQVLAARFPGRQAGPVTVVAALPAGDPRIAAYAARLGGQPGVAAVSIEQGCAATSARSELVPAGSVQGPAAGHLVQALRAHRPGVPHLVRCVLVAAMMTLPGRANWWAPGPLRRLHRRFGQQESPAHPGREAVAEPRSLLPVS